MRIGNTLARLFHGTTIQSAKHRSEQDLFHADGWIPQVNSPRRYFGPSFPVPMLSRSTKLPAEPVRLCNAARKEWSEGNLAMAEQNYVQAEASMHKTPELLYEHAQLLLTEKRYDEAEALLLRAVAMKPLRYEFWTSLLWISYIRMDRETSVWRLNRIICCGNAPDRKRLEATSLVQDLE